MDNLETLPMDLNNIAAAAVEAAAAIHGDVLEDPEVKPASSASLPQGKPDEPQGVPLTAMDMDKEAKTGNPGIDKGKIDKSEMDKVEKCDKNAANRDVLALMELKPEAPLILRREQLSAPFRAGDDGETEDAEMPDGEGDGDHKSDHGEEEGDDPVLKKPAARRSRAKAKAKATAKAKAKAAAKAKAKAGAKAKAAAKAVPEAKAKTSRKSVANADGDTGAKEKGRRPAATFAKRWKPDNEEGAARFLAIRDVFMSHIAPKLQAQSSFQDGWFTLCTRLFRGSDAVGYPEYVALATEKVTEFLNMESVRSAVKQDG
ncbi:unnamed protein product [Cladocopium goreaui]|uniref:Uncharacterized protein n=1 Tax=Cladocopium goreaui TaxID=2562237 RepID=A0A9P1D760_9DINO|nr:unnamed protein product [Cladocopium goreaui]